MVSDTAWLWQIVMFSLLIFVGFFVELRAALFTSPAPAQWSCPDNLSHSALASVSRAEVIEAHAWNSDRDSNNEPTDLCRCFQEEHSDKALFFFGHETRNNYSAFYFKVLQSARYQRMDIFELGIGSADINTPSNMTWMGENVTPLASHRAWKRFFPNSRVYGCDVAEDCIVQEDRIATGLCDQTKEKGVAPLLQRFGTCFDFIIEDGLHEDEANINALRESWPFLKRGGLYFVEDIDKRLRMQDMWETRIREKDLPVVDLDWGVYLVFNWWDMVVLRKSS